MCRVIGELHVLDAWSVWATVFWEEQRGMWRCWALRRFVVSRRAAGAQAAGGCSVGCVQYLGSLKNVSTRTEDTFGSPRSLCAAVQGYKAMWHRICHAH